MKLPIAMKIMAVLFAVMASMITRVVKTRVVLIMWQHVEMVFMIGKAVKI